MLRKFIMTMLKDAKRPQFLNFVENENRLKLFISSSLYGHHLRVSNKNFTSRDFSFIHQFNFTLTKLDKWPKILCKVVAFKNCFVQSTKARVMNKKNK